LGRNQAIQQFQQNRLATSAGPHNPVDFPAQEAKVQTLKDGFLIEGEEKIASFQDDGHKKPDSPLRK
jgi:hypothetical protein